MFSHDLICTDSGRDLTLTPNHFILCGTLQENPILTKAEDVEVGSYVMTVDGKERGISNISFISHIFVSVANTFSFVVFEVTSVSGLRAPLGIYTVVTELEFVVVNGIVASPFSLNHAIGNAYYNIYRSLFSICPALFKDQSSWLLKAHRYISQTLISIL